jgi:hypothetical protein
LGEVGLAELARADIDRDAQVRRLRVVRPGRQLLAGGGQRPLAEFHDQAGLLGLADELRRIHHAALRMLPAHQRLHPGEAAVGTHDGLVMQAQFAPYQGVAQVVFQHGHLVQHFLHGGTEETIGIAAGRLGLVHGHVGLAQQVIDGMPAGAEQHHAQAGCAAYLMPCSS